MSCSASVWLLPDCYPATSAIPPSGTPVCLLPGCCLCPLVGAHLQQTLQSQMHVLAQDGVLAYTCCRDKEAWAQYKVVYTAILNGVIFCVLLFPVVALLQSSAHSWRKLWSVGLLRKSVLHGFKGLRIADMPWDSWELLQLCCCWCTASCMLATCNALSDGVCLRTPDTRKNRIEYNRKKWSICR